MNRAYLVTGSNMGNREQYLAKARNLIAEYAEIIQASSIYETAAWGKTDQRSFLNQALEISTPMDPDRLMKSLLLTEKTIGRVREVKYGERVIDIDIIFFNDLVQRSSSLKIPHPEMQNRRFVLAPLYEIAPEIIHPVIRKTVATLLEDCPDPLLVRRTGGVE
ncbi:MAG: 2-amino-4-hydroxy-6-hydroxymethyldihydropteridine diphosphokinase [Chitinophagaceae bacterium]|nr:2-amino-4-hydroxy-6-hydroxymethyldihydropteridine diphosphokinase [Chitinophagaceae bacterium]